MDTHKPTLNKLAAFIRRLRGEKRSFITELMLVLRVLTGVLSTFVVCCTLTVPIGVGGYLAALLQWTLTGAAVLRGRLRLLSSAAALVLAAGLFLHWQERRATVHGPTLGEATAVPPATDARAINWLISEEDGVFLAARALSVLRGITPQEAGGLFPRLNERYGRFRSVQGDVPTPLIATTLLLQSSRRSDLIVLRSSSAPEPNRRAILFLHGFGGNWSLLCFLVAEGAPAHDTFCPSVGFMGMWSSEAGTELVERMVLELKKRGYSEIVLAGLSAGAVGASEIAARNPNWFNGVVLLFGAHPDSARLELPTLYIYGTRDERFPPAWVKRFADSHAEKYSDVTVRALPVDHFALIKETPAVTSELQSWLAGHFPDR